MMSLRILVPLFVALLATSCLGGDENPESQRDSSPVVDATASAGQSDYLERATELLSLLARENAVNIYPLYYITPEAGWVEESARAVEEWEKLVPPTELAREHAAMARHVKAMVEAYEDERYDAILTFKEPWNEWWNSVEEYYDVHLFQNRSPFMEPTLCRNDVFVIPPTDGELERFQLAVLKRGPIESEFKPKERPNDILRVVGLAGETITIGPEGVVIDGARLEGDVYAPRQADTVFGPVTIPEGQYFLLADKRWKAIDSRNSAVSIGAPTFYDSDDFIGELPADTPGCVVNEPSLD
jgi:signal peptidase I